MSVNSGSFVVNVDVTVQYDPCFHWGKYICKTILLTLMCPQTYIHTLMWRFKVVVYSVEWYLYVSITAELYAVQLYKSNRKPCSPLLLVDFVHSPNQACIKYIPGLWLNTPYHIFCDVTSIIVVLSTCFWLGESTELYSLAQHETFAPYTTCLPVNNVTLMLLNCIFVVNGQCMLSLYILSMPVVKCLQYIVFCWWIYPHGVYHPK